MQSFHESRFQAQMDAALARIRTILDHTRNPRLPADEPHRYDDKYLLASYLTTVTMASLLQCLETVGMSAAMLTTLRGWAQTQAVTIRFKAREECSYLREETRKVESATEYVTEWKSSDRSRTTRTDKVITDIVEHVWGFDFSYEITAFAGAALDQAVSLRARAGHQEIRTRAKTTPRPKSVVRPSLDVNLTWLLGRINAADQLAFEIDRTAAACHTPRRNPQVEEALLAVGELYSFCEVVTSYFTKDLFSAQPDHGLDLSAIQADSVFIPAVPLFEESTDGVVPVAYMNSFLAEERRSLRERCQDLLKIFPADAGVITSSEAVLLVTLMHAQAVCQRYQDGVDYVEGMLRKQLCAAIGDVVTPADFTEYMAFHERKLFRADYQPQPFAHAVRRPDHDPEGVLSLEARLGSGSPSAPVSTTVVHGRAERPMSFALDASTRVSFGGDRYLHGLILHQFSHVTNLSLELVARARQFSSFVVLVGRIASAETFEPRFGIIVQNKDLLKIPLLLEPIPTPKEFRDAIASLSPEQQRFARAFRGMQLESTLFGVCVIQIKPQLEKLLRLPPDCLTKETKLTQDLLGLFIEHQIPSDLLSYDGEPAAPAGEKLERVKSYVARIQEMIDLSKRRELEEAKAREAYRLAEANRSPQLLHYPPAPGGPLLPQMPCAAAGGAAVPRMNAASASPASMPDFAEMDIAEERNDGAAPAEAVPAGEPQPASDAERPPIGAESEIGGDRNDYTRIPKELDRRFEELDEDGALRPTIIHPGDRWTLESQKSLLAKPTTETLTDDAQEAAKHKAFDLLGALTKSGALAIEDASLHVLMAATHCFDKTLLETVIQDNVNPIEKVERSLMIVATTLHNRPALELIKEDQVDRFFAASPRLKPLAAAKPREEA